MLSQVERHQLRNLEALVSHVKDHDFRWKHCVAGCVVASVSPGMKSQTCHGWKSLHLSALKFTCHQDWFHNCNLLFETKQGSRLGKWRGESAQVCPFFQFNNGARHAVELRAAGAGGTLRVACRARSESEGTMPKEKNRAAHGTELLFDFFQQQNVLVPSRHGISLIWRRQRASRTTAIEHLLWAHNIGF